MSKLQSLAVGAVVVLVAACVDGSREPITSPSANTPTAVTPGNAAIQANPPEEAQAKFHKKNYADWVGKAHNKALDDFFAATIAQKGTPENICVRILEFMSEPGRIPTDKNQGTREQRRAFAGAALSATPMCQGQLAENRLPKLWLASAVRSASVEGISSAANYLLDQIRNAQANATTASGLATALTPILTQADQLVSGERDLVYAAASVTQSSFEYWQANLQPLGDEVAATHGGCLVQYSYEPYALNTCLGIAGAPIQPTAYRNLGNGTHFFYATSSQTSCSSVFDLGAAVEMDFQGAVAGGLLGWALSPPGIFLGAVGGGTTASLAVGAWQTGRYAYCKVRGGGTNKTGIRPT